jgi:hypothetical protein
LVLVYAFFVHGQEAEPTVTERSLRIAEP